MSKYINFENFSKNSTIKEKNLFDDKLSFVKFLVRKQLRSLIKSPLVAHTIHISPGKEIYEKVLNTKTPEIGANVYENKELLEELTDIAFLVALEVTSTLNKSCANFDTDSDSYLEESELLYQLRGIIQKLAYKSLKELGYNVELKQVYIYGDLPIYRKFKEVVSKAGKKELGEILKDSNVYRLGGVPFVGENANEIITRNQDFILFIDEFIKYYQENEELFIERYKVNEGAGEIAVYHLERLIESSGK